MWGEKEGKEEEEGKGGEDTKEGSYNAIILSRCDEMGISPKSEHELPRDMLIL